MLSIRMWKTFVCFTLAASGSVHAAEYLPLAQGNTWTYQDAVTGGSFEVRVSTPVFVNQSVYYSVTGFGPKRLLLRTNESGNIAMWDEDREQELLVTSFETSPIVGQFEAYGRQCATLGKTQTGRKAYDGPAGRWDVAEIQYQPYGCADAGELMEQYTENIGMVRRVVNTIAGPRTFDLVHARVGRQVIDAGEAGRFTITALPGVDRASWDATLRVDPFFSSGVAVRFPSGQEYNVRLRDADGKVLWTWATGILFTQTEHTVSLGGWQVAVRVPFPAVIPEGPSSYILEAWLTTAEGEPQFAAATGLVLLGESTKGAAKAARRR